MYCKADSARLCLSCDRHVHSANALSLRHPRTLLCDGCNLQPASVRCQDENLSLCLTCDCRLHQAGSERSLHQRHSFDSFSGCPSAAELAVLWGCQVRASGNQSATRGTASTSQHPLTQQLGRISAVPKPGTSASAPGGWEVTFDGGVQAPSGALREKSRTAKPRLSAAAAPHNAPTGMKAGNRRGAPENSSILENPGSVATGSSIPRVRAGLAPGVAGHNWGSYPPGQGAQAWTSGSNGYASSLPGSRAGMLAGAKSSQVLQTLMLTSLARDGQQQRLIPSRTQDSNAARSALASHSSQLHKPAARGGHRTSPVPPATGAQQMSRPLQPVGGHVVESPLGNKKDGSQSGSADAGSMGVAAGPGLKEHVKGLAMGSDTPRGPTPLLYPLYEQQEGRGEGGGIPATEGSGTGQPKIPEGQPNTPQTGAKHANLARGIGATRDDTKTGLQSAGSSAGRKSPVQLVPAVSGEPLDAGRLDQLAPAAGNGTPKGPLAVQHRTQGMLSSRSSLLDSPPGPLESMTAEVGFSAGTSGDPRGEDPGASPSSVQRGSATSLPSSLTSTATPVITEVMAELQREEASQQALESAGKRRRPEEWGWGHEDRPPPAVWGSKGANANDFGSAGAMVKMEECQLPPLSVDDFLDSQGGGKGGSLGFANDMPQSKESRRGSGMVKRDGHRGSAAGTAAAEAAEAMAAAAPMKLSDQDLGYATGETRTGGKARKPPLAPQGVKEEARHAGGEGEACPEADCEPSLARQEQEHEMEERNAAAGLSLVMEDMDFQTGLGEWEDIFELSGMGDEGMMDFKDFRPGDRAVRSLSRTPEYAEETMMTESALFDTGTHMVPMGTGQTNGAPMVAKGGYQKLPSGLSARPSTPMAEGCTAGSSRGGSGLGQEGMDGTSASLQSIPESGPFAYRRVSFHPILHPSVSCASPFAPCSC